ncbi:MAG: stage II sporulation protein M [Nanoarchaeota archaeon]
MVKKKNKENFLKKNYQLSFRYIRESRNFIYAVIGVFIFSSLIGFFVPAPAYVAEQISKFIEELLRQTQDMSVFELIRFIFINNFKSSLSGMALGVFLGIFPMISIIANGYILGFVVLASVNSDGILVLWRLFPHGIFELPAVFISLGMGLRIGLPFIYRYFSYYSKKENVLALISGVLFLVPAIIFTLIFNNDLRKHQLKNFSYRFKSSLKVFVLIVIPLLIVAAIIEGSLIVFMG